MTLIRETECMVRLGLSVPFSAHTLLQKQNTLKKNYDKLQVIYEYRTGHNNHYEILHVLGSLTLGLKTLKHEQQNNQRCCSFLIPIIKRDKPSAIPALPPKSYSNIKITLSYFRIPTAPLRVIFYPPFSKHTTTVLTDKDISVTQQLLLEQHSRVLEKIPQTFKPLMAPHLAKVDASIEPGLMMLNWTSLNIETYVDSVYDALGEFELLLNRANDLVAYRIDAVLEEMSVIPLIELPTHAPKTIEEFLKSTEVRGGHWTDVLFILKLTLLAFSIRLRKIIKGKFGVPELNLRISVTMKFCVYFRPLFLERNIFPFRPRVIPLSIISLFNGDGYSSNKDSYSDHVSFPRVSFLCLTVAHEKTHEYGYHSNKESYSRDNDTWSEMKKRYAQVDLRVNEFKQWDLAHEMRRRNNRNCN